MGGKESKGRSLAGASRSRCRPSEGGTGMQLWISLGASSTAMAWSLH